MNFNTLPFTLRQLQYAVAVAEARGFRKAAELCHVSQPALSTQIAELEGALGFALFERDPRRVLVTSSGQAFLGLARRVLAQAADAADSIARQRDPLTAQVRIGVIPTVAPYLLPSLIPALKDAMPQLRPVFSEETTQTLMKRLDDGDLDAAVLAGPEGLERFDCLELGFDAFCVAVSVRSPLSKEPSLELDDLAGEVVLLLEEGHCLRDQVVHWCGRSDAGGVRATSLSTLLQLVASGAGVTLLPGLAAAAEGQRGDITLVPLKAPAPGRNLMLVWRKGAPVEPVMAPLSAVARRCVASLAAPACAAA